jgi:hypothetical protein
LSSAPQISARAFFAPGCADFGSADRTFAVLWNQQRPSRACGKHLPQPVPEPQRPVADGQYRGAHAPAGAVAQQVRPRLGRGEPPPLAGTRVGALVVDPRRGHLDRARAGQHLPALTAAVADHQPAARFIPLGSVRRDAGIHLGLQRLGQHPPGTLPDNLINQRRRRRAVAASRIRDYGKHRAVPSRPARQRRPLLETSTTRSPGRYTPFSRPSRQIHRSQALLARAAVTRGPSPGRAERRWQSPLLYPHGGRGVTHVRG